MRGNAPVPVPCTLYLMRPAWTSQHRQLQLQLQLFTHSHSHTHSPKAFVSCPIPIRPISYPNTQRLIPHALRAQSQREPYPHDMHTPNTKHAANCPNPIPTRFPKTITFQSLTQKSSPSPSPQTPPHHPTHYPPSPSTDSPRPPAAAAQTLEMRPAA